MFIQAQNISKKYGSTEALKNISFEINKNELFGFIGPDGAGKTTLFRILTTLLLADSGKAVIHNWDIVADYKQIRNNVGYMPGRFSLYQDLTVEENLKFFATIFGTSIEENYELIKQIYVQIEPFKKRLAGKLSGGMKQKLALCCALIHKPLFLVLDEPTTGVDAVSRREFWDMLKELRNQGITIIVSTPYMDEAVLCDRVALMQSGEIMSINTPSEIIKTFPHPLFAIRSNYMHKLKTDCSLYSNCHSINLFGQYLHFSTKLNDLNTTELHSFLSERGHLDIELHKIEPTIEDCFIELMNAKTLVND